MTKCSEWLKVLSLEAQEYIVYALGDRRLRSNYYINAFYSLPYLWEKSGMLNSMLKSQSKFYST